MEDTEPQQVVYVPSQETVSLFTRYCGLSDPEEVKKRADAIREKALAVHSYLCIR